MQPRKVKAKLKSNFNKTQSSILGLHESIHFFNSKVRYSYHFCEDCIYNIMACAQKRALLKIKTKTISSAKIR